MLSYKVLQTLGGKDCTKGKEMLVRGSRRLHEAVGFGSKKTIRHIRMLKHTLIVGMNMSTIFVHLAISINVKCDRHFQSKEIIGYVDKDGIKEEKTFSSNLLGLLTEALQIKLTHDRLTTEKGLFHMDRRGLTEMT